MNLTIIGVPREWKLPQRRAHCGICKASQWTRDGQMPKDHDRPDGRVCKPIVSGALPDIAVEFPEFDVSTLPGEIPGGFVASHWHNEACPSWSHPYLGLQIWIDYADTSMRDFPDGRRFTLEYMPGDCDDKRRMVLAWSDDWAVVLATLQDLDAAMIASRWVKRFGLGFHPDTRGVDYVDAAYVRCLSDVEAAEYEVDIDTLFGLCDPYEAGLRAMDAAGLNVG